MSCANSLPDPFAYKLGRVEVGVIQERNELIAAVSKKDVREAESGGCVLNDMSEHTVTNSSTMKCVDPFESNDVDKKESEGRRLDE